MKTAIKTLGVLTMLTAFAVGAQAQEKESNEKKDIIKIRTEVYENGEKRVEEKVIDATGLTKQEREARIEALTEEALKDYKKSKKIKVVIDDDDVDVEIEGEDENVFRLEGDQGAWVGEDRFSIDEERPEIHIYKRKLKKGSDIDFDIDEFSNRMRYLGEELPRRIERHLPRIYTWTDDQFSSLTGSTIQSLDAFPNRPNNNRINVRFYVPNTGDVNITVLDLNGNIVGKESVKDFEGEFAGQVELSEEPKGTYFVIVAQGEDGMSRKVVIE